MVTVGALKAGTTANVIPDEAELLLNVRAFDTAVRAKVLKAIERIVRAEAHASGATREPLLEPTMSAPFWSTTRGRQLGDVAHPHRMMITAGQQRRPRRRAQRGVVEPVIPQPGGKAGFEPATP